jgi:hypothetical protein
MGEEEACFQGFALPFQAITGPETPIRQRNPVSRDINIVKHQQSKKSINSIL